MVARHQRRRDPHPELAFAGLPFAPARPPLGVPPKGAAKPSAHETAILRRAAVPGAFIMRTHTERGTVYVFGDNGEVILGAGTKYTRKPLSEDEFKRLAQWLVPERNDSLFDFAPAQRWDVRRLELDNG
jgi:hypothetical protein